jgi:hypothetical protein
MAADYAKMSDDLCRFYDFSGKVVLFIGAAGRQLLPFPPAQNLTAPSDGNPIQAKDRLGSATRPVKKLIAIDRDITALEALRADIAAKGLQNIVEVIGGDFEEVTAHGDAIYFEFCLHEMDDPDRALRHAKSLASDIVVYDHSAGSEWIFYGAEEDKVARSSAEMQRFGIRQRLAFEGEQRFATYDELLAKVASQGPLAVERAQRFAGAKDIVIPFSYELNLL